jgi:hypothetical protein
MSELRVSGLILLLALAAAPASAQTTIVIVNGMGEPPSFATCADALGDWDGDGVGDLCVGMPEINPGGIAPGTVCIISGTNGLMIEQLAGSVPKGRFGALVAGVGDADGDGVVDVAVGSLPLAAGLLPRVTLISGADGEPLFIKPLPLFGLAALDGIGDADGDGHADLAKGGFACSGGGAMDPGDVTLWSGATGALLHTWCGGGAGDHFGSALAAAGDVNGDGHADLLAGASQADAAGGGYVRILSGLDGAVLQTITGPAGAGTGFGASVDNAGDVNGDGTPDVLVGSAQELVGGEALGSARVYSGLDGSLLRHVSGTLADAGFGMEVAGPGDLDGDGLADFAVASSALDAPGSPPGYAVFSGADAALLHQVAVQASMPMPPSIALRAAGDINGDGMPDLLARCYQPNPPMMAFPTIRVFSGAPVLFEDLGFALAGAATPHLQVEGLLATTLPLTLSIGGAPPHAPLALFLGVSTVHLPFKGGTLVPAPQLLVAGLVADGAGAFSLSTTTTGALPWGVPVVLQAWMPDVAAPSHFAATNAVQGVTQ